MPCLDVLGQGVQFRRRVEILARAAAEHTRRGGIVTEFETKLGAQPDAGAADPEGLDVDGRLPLTVAFTWSCRRGFETKYKKVTFTHPIRTVQFYCLTCLKIFQPNDVTIMCWLNDIRPTDFGQNDTVSILRCRGCQTFCPPGFPNF
jgi:hypothetical protein